MDRKEYDIGETINKLLFKQKRKYNQKFAGAN